MPNFIFIVGALAAGKTTFIDLNFNHALNNTIKYILENGKDFMIQIHFTNEQTQEQFIIENGTLTYRNKNITNYAENLLREIQV